jgi:hypothetical protein
VFKRKQRDAAAPAGAGGTVTEPGDRLLERPAFILSSVRSGSTLLRVLLDSHSQLHAPHELHIRHLTVRLRNKPVRKAMAELGLGRKRLQFLLWDRLLHRELTRHGKRYLVNKTPSDVFIANAIKECWPDARFVYLLRHPAAIAASRARARPQDSEARNLAAVRRYTDALEKARAKHPGHVIRYESLTEDPRGELEKLCAFLDVPFEESMLDYARFDHGAYKVGLGDWTEKIRSGEIQPATPPPAEVPEALREVAAAWGY